jgi:hypothetical protein
MLEKCAKDLLKVTPAPNTSICSISQRIECNRLHILDKLDEQTKLNPGQTFKQNSAPHVPLQVMADVYILPISFPPTDASPVTHLHGDATGTVETNDKQTLFNPPNRP